MVSQSFIRINFICISIPILIVCANLAVEYEHSAFLDGEENYKLYWTVKEGDVSINLAVEVKTTGWIGLGISLGLSGSMKGADIVIGWVDSSGKGHLSDRYATSNSMPLFDQHQDYELTEASQENGTTALKFKRKIKTCDENDNDILLGTTKVIYAYGKTDDVKYHGSSARGARSLNLMNYVKNIPPPATAKHFDVLVKNVSVPAVKTTYWCEAFKLSTLVKLSGTKHIIEIAPLVQEKQKGIVHHITLYTCQDNFSDHHLNTSGPCSNPNMPDSIRDCSQRFAQAYAWATGGGNFKFPDHVGLPIGSHDSMKYVVLEIHFDNPSQNGNFLVTTGLRFYYDVPRKYEAGMLMTGASATGAMIIPPHQKSWILNGYCSKECSSKIAGPSALNGNGIKFFSSFPHAHTAGTGIWTKHVRDGIELNEVIRDDNYDTNYQETHLLKKEILFKAGDELVTQCRYNTMKRKDATVGGLPTYKEMCINFIMYYPRANLTTCFGHDNWVNGAFSVRYARPVWKDRFNTYNKSLPPLSFQFKNWTNIKWNETMVKELKNAYAHNSPHALLGFCFGSFGYRYNITTSWKTVIVKNLPLPKSVCTKKTNSGHNLFLCDVLLFIWVSQTVLVLIAF